MTTEDVIALIKTGLAMLLAFSIYKVGYWMGYGAAKLDEITKERK